jgi:hypothetical protein
MYEKINKEVTNLVKDNLVREREINKFSQLKTFVDTAIKKTASKQYESSEAKLEDLFLCLLQIRDYLNAESVENSFKNNLLAAFNSVEERIRKEEEALKESQVKSERTVPLEVEESLEEFIVPENDYIKKKHKFRSIKKLRNGIKPNQTSEEQI